MKTKVMICTIVLLLSAFTGSVFGGNEGITNTFYGSGAGNLTPLGGSEFATFLGRNAGSHNTTGTSNTFVGADTGYYNTTGTSNTFVGRDAGTSNFSGNDNTFVGTSAGYSNTFAGSNTFVGYDAGHYNTTGIFNTFVGRASGVSNTTGSQNIFVGVDAGFGNTEGTDNTFVGFYAGRANTTGSTNTFLGREAGYSNTTANENTFLGYHTGRYNTTGYANTFVGLEAGGATTLGDSNTFVGGYAGRVNSTGNSNTYLGRSAGFTNTTGQQNTFVGYGTGYNNATGSGNVFLGYWAGYSEAGSNRLYIDNSGTSTPLIYGEFDNRILTINGNLEVIGPYQGLVYLSNTTADSTNKVSRMVLNHYSNAELPLYLFGAASTATDNFVAFGGGNTIGNAATRIDLFTAGDTTTPVGTSRLTIIGNGYVGIGIDPLYPLEMGSGAYVTTGGVWTNASSREYKDNIEALTTEEAFDTIKELNPVKFAYKKDMNEKHVGFIAEEVPELVSMKDRKGLSPMDIVAVLTKVVQEQQDWLKELKAKNERLEQRLLALEGKDRTEK